MPNEPAQPSLFDRLGGDAAIEACVVAFYERVMADEELAPFFQHMDVDAQIKKQIAFLSSPGATCERRITSSCSAG